MHGFEQLIRQQEERQARESGGLACARYDPLLEPEAVAVDRTYKCGMRVARTVVRVLHGMQGWLWTDVREALLVVLTFVEQQCPAEEKGD